MDDGKQAQLRRYLEKIAPDGSLESMAESTGGAEGLEAAGSPVGRRTLEKLSRGEALDRNEQFHLEAIIIPDKRPAIDILDDSYIATHPLWRHWNEARIKDPLERAIPSIGRIELPGHPRLPYGGTGFVVGNGRLMTNRHVAELFSSGLGLRELNFLPGRRAEVDFKRERDSTTSLSLKVRRVVMIHPHWDMALLEVEGLAPDHPPLKLALTPPDGLVSKEVALIGYPAFDPRNPADVQQEVFGGVYEIKRLQPGFIGARRRVDSFGHAVEALTHDASTLGGNSGSAAVDPLTGDVFALHFSGAYLDANFGVPAFELSRDGRVIDAGVQFSGTPQRGTTPWDQAWSGNEASTGTTRPAVSPPPASPPPAPTPAAGGGQGAVAADGSVTFSVPLEITVRLGQPNAGPVVTAVAGAAAATEAMVEPFHNTNYGSRQGYDPNFLGLSVAAPKPAKPSSLADVEGGGNELRYTHFSVWMHKRRRLALMTASNIDASAARKRPENRPKEDYGRDGLGGLGPNDDELWFTDGRIAAGEQLSDRFFRLDRQSFDKGHIVRREDVAWGDTYDELREANGDTYHVTNCSPQVKGFNRSAAPGSKTNWGDLENLVLKQAKTEKLSLFAGPVLDPADKTFVGVDDDGPVEVQIPSRFWKLAVARSGDELQAFGFLLEQDLSDTELEFAVPDIWVPLMISLADLEPLAGVRFSAALHNADQSGASGGESIRRAARLGTVAAQSPRGTAQPSPGGPAMSDEGAAILALWRAEAGETGGPGARFVLNFAKGGQQPADDVTAAAITRATGLEVRVGRLFQEADPDLDVHRLVEVARVSRLDRSDMFEVARILRDISGAETVDPDLGTDYYDWPDTTPDGGHVESVAFWCWADDAQKPADTDWAIKATKVPEAWTFSQTSGHISRGSGIRIFQADTGLTNHPELPPGAVGNPGAINLIETNTPPTDPMAGGLNPGHGTGTGSVAASPETLLMRGSAPAATLVPIRCIESVAVFDQSPVAQAINHARLNGADIITMSLGGIFSGALHAALRKAVEANIIVVAAAGNCVGAVVWPARYEEAIAVGGINAALQPWKGSSRGSDVDISGPAEFVLAADPRVAGNPAAVTAGQGTSYATAHLAGVAALWLAHHGRAALEAMLPSGVTLQEMFRNLIQQTAIVPPGFDIANFGAGIVNAEALLNANPATALGLEAVFAAPSTDMRRQVAELLAEVNGQAGLEVAAPALGDLQNAPELACVALDQLRRDRRKRSTLEAMPPTGLSPGLRRAMGARATEFLQTGGRRDG